MFDAEGRNEVTLCAGSSQRSSFEDGSKGIGLRGNVVFYVGKKHSGTASLQSNQVSDETKSIILFYSNLFVDFIKISNLINLTNEKLISL